MSLQDDIEQLRSAFEYDLINQDLKQPVNRVCDALEASQKDIAVLSENLAVSNAAAVDLGAKLEASLKTNEQLGKNVQHWMEECFKENKAKIEARKENITLSEALRLLLSEAGRTVDLSVDWSPDTAVSLVLHWGTIQKARKALGGREVMSLQRTY